ncbi:sugar kinase [Mucilaginibacter sp. UR6-1]|uniref:sugar kinase n=1 Tax=Mucilaginibacter sp. UR6-1 TaxID=1435643 RepID=UPI001E5745B3|nr:sugar kinase [Mucilaginibacter sp. UR6-1]MCC8408634.1 sugar kinase [Mucilaginibacter sp. UR6-1]
MEKNILCFGELLLRITPDAGGDWLNTNNLPFFIGGAELNVATALALWQLPVQYYTALPDNYLSKQLLGHLQQNGIVTDKVRFWGDRIGLYYLTKGQDVKHDALIYDRAHSSFSELKPGIINWDEVLADVSWVHFSAISPAVSQSAADVCLEAVKAASAKGITISVDLNYRAKLWKYGKSPVEIMQQLLPYCDVVMGNVWAAEAMLGIEVVPDIHESGQKSIYLKEALNTSEEIVKRYPKCKAVANTFRFGNDNDINYYTALYTAGQFISSKEYSSNQIVDKVGSGDCYMAGLIYGMYNNWAPAEVLEYATAAAFTKLFVESDTTNKTVNDIQKAISNE